MSNLKAAVVGETVFCVTNAKEPEPAAWDLYMKQLGEHLTQRDGQSGRLVVFAGGGTPNSAMRLQLRNVVEKRPLLTAVVTDSAVVRSIISVFALFVNGTRGFATRDWKEALKYVGFPMESFPDLLAPLRQLDTDVGTSASLVEMLKER